MKKLPILDAILHDFNGHPKVISIIEIVASAINVRDAEIKRLRKTINQMREGVRYRNKLSKG